MMKEYHFIYKCRRCGIVHSGPITGNQNIAETSLVGAVVNGVAHAVGASVSLISTHVCKDDGYGVSDLQGVEVKRKDNA